MINIVDKSHCCGCESCVQICSKGCVHLIRDFEGFLYPKVDESSCVKCGLCEKVCPCLNDLPPRYPLSVHAAHTKDETIRSKSSSGGIFYELSKRIIDDGGIVFGVVIDDNFTVRYGFAESVDELSLLMGSKYVQAEVGNTYKFVRTELRKGRKVLFSGTPCQVKALFLFLQHNYANLFCVEILCHGVPSPGIWKQYLAEKYGDLNANNEDSIQVFNRKKKVLNSSLDARSLIRDIKFRDKTDGWKKFRFVVFRKASSNMGKNTVLSSEYHYDNVFLKNFFNNCILRPSCYFCKAKKGTSMADIALGDFWGIESRDNRFRDDKGTSMALIYTKKGMGIWDSVKETLYCLAKDYNLAFECCTMIENSATLNPKRSAFFRAYKKGKSVIHLLRSDKWNNLSFKERMLDKVRNMVRFKIIYDSTGQTCNRFWAYLDIIAWALINNRKVYILFWDNNFKNYPNLLNSQYVSFPLWSHSLSALFGEHTYKCFINRFFNNALIQKIFASRLLSKLGFIYGWGLRNNSNYFPSVRKQIHDIFLPETNVVKKIEIQILQVRENYSIIIGVHIRRGDYKEWMNGKYYFNDDEILCYMRQIKSLFINDNVVFLLASNEKLVLSKFSEFSVFTINEGSVAGDLYALEKCDYIIGPLSTFSRWASFMGNVPLCFIEKGKGIDSLEQFSVISEFYKFENGKLIKNLSS